MSRKLTVTFTVDIGVDCPLCDNNELEPIEMERENGKVVDTYHCERCNLFITYTTPDDGRGEYWQYDDSEIELSFSHN